MEFTNVLNDADISFLLQNETVTTVLSSDAVKTRFRMPLPDTVKEKLKDGLGLDLFSVPEVPMMYIRGDMAPHVDSGVSDFKNTYLVYLTDSGGKFVVDNTEYDIQKGCGFKFERGLLHGTTGTEDEGRLMVGPLSDIGLEVGATPYLVFTLTSASTTDFTVNVIQLEVGSQSTDSYEFQFYKNAGQLMNTYNYQWNPTQGSITTAYATIVSGLSYSPGDTFNVAIKNKGAGGQFRYADNNISRNSPTFNDVTVPGGGGGGGAPCFVASSQLLTPTGYCAAKDIKTGDLLMTADGRKVPVKAYSFTVENTDKDSAPFLIPTNSLSPSCPKADLRLSPWHAFQLKKGLWMKPMSAFELGMPVKQYDLGKSVTYYHFEAPDFFKDNFVCEGTVVESFGGVQTKDMKGRVYTYNANLKGYTRVAAKSVTKAIMM